MVRTPPGGGGGGGDDFDPSTDPIMSPLPVSGDGNLFQSFRETRQRQVNQLADDEIETESGDRAFAGSDPVATPSSVAVIPSGGPNLGVIAAVVAVVGILVALVGGDS